MMGEILNMTSDYREATSVAWHPLHENMFASGGFDGSLLYWIVPNTRPQAAVATAHDNAIWSMDWHPMGHLLATGGWVLHTLSLPCLCRCAYSLLSSAVE